MPAAPGTVPVAEQAIGIGFYLSTTPGVAGRLKATPEEFRVREISTYPRPDPEGAYVVIRVASRGWEQHELAEAIARRLGLPGRAIEWSGTKDRRAVSERLFAYRGPWPPDDLALPDVRIAEAYRAVDGLVLGHHYGNAFELRVSDLATAPEAAVIAYRATEESLRAAGGFPNFFGPQRFGEVRPVTHLVGRAIVRGDLAGAVDVYLCDRPPEGAEGPGDAARAAFAEHRDPLRALREYPPEYRFERSILERMARGQPPERAFRALPFELRRLFVHAYQSYLFNRLLTERRRRGLPLAQPEVGDRIVRVGRDGTIRAKEAVPVDVENRPECADLVARGRAFVAAPLVGPDATGGEGIVGGAFREILEEEGVSPISFDVPGAPEIGSRGAWRPILVPMPPLGLTPDADGVWVRFALPKGAYATVLLREFLKDGASHRLTAPGTDPSSRAY